MKSVAVQELQLAGIAKSVDDKTVGAIVWNVKVVIPLELRTTALIQMRYLSETVISSIKKANHEPHYV